MKPQPLVTKQFLLDNLATRPVETVGRALVALFHYQTADEQAGNSTRKWNRVGFTKADGRTGALGAKYYLKHGKLEDWQLKLWTGLNKKGEPRILKYAKQLNQIAHEKAKPKRGE